MQAEQTQKTLTLSERFAAMAPKKQKAKPAAPAKPSQAKMHIWLLQHAADLAFEGFIASDPNLGAALRHLNGERTRRIDLPQVLEVEKFPASVSRIIGDDRRSGKTLEGLVAQVVCQRLAAHFAVLPATISARSRFMTGSETRGKERSSDRPHFTLTLRWQSY
jgi:hypothetical protein